MLITWSLWWPFLLRRWKFIPLYKYFCNASLLSFNKFWLYGIMSLSVTVSLEWLSSHFRWGGGGGLSEWGWRPGDHHSGLLLARKGRQWNGMAALHSRVYIYISMHNINFYGRMNVCDEWVSDCVSMCGYVCLCVCVMSEWVAVWAYMCILVHIHVHVT